MVNQFYEQIKKVQNLVYEENYSTAREKLLPIRKKMAELHKASWLTDTEVLSLENELSKLENLIYRA